MFPVGTDKGRILAQEEGGGGGGREESGGGEAAMAGSEHLANGQVGRKCSLTGGVGGGVVVGGDGGKPERKVIDCECKRCRSKRSLARG